MLIIPSKSRSFLQTHAIRKSLQIKNFIVDTEIEPVSSLILFMILVLNFKT
jgi:hypothetical protein